MIHQCKGSFKKTLDKPNITTRLNEANRSSKESINYLNLHLKKQTEILDIDLFDFR